MDSRSFRNDRSTRNIAMVLALAAFCFFMYAFSTIDWGQPQIEMIQPAQPGVSSPEVAASQVYTGKAACDKLHELGIRLIPHCD